MSSNFAVTAMQKRIFFFGLAAVTLLLALNEFLNPSETRPDGRWSVFYAWTWDAWGSVGVVGFFLLETMVFALVAIFARGEK